MDEEELEEVYRKLMERRAPDSPAARALTLSKQILMAGSIEAAAEPLFGLIDLLSKVEGRERFMVVFSAKLLPFACTGAGGKVFEGMAERMETGER